MTANFYPGQPGADYLAKLNELATANDVADIWTAANVATAKATTATTKAAEATEQAANGRGSATRAEAASQYAAECAADAMNAKTEAENSASSANAAWTAALVANPTLNPVVRMHPNKVTENLTIPESYNASSIGPLSIAEGVTVTLNNNSVWSIA